MVSDSSTNIRLENVERAVGQLTDRVGDIAKFMERLVSIEERNGFMTQKHEELKQTLKESIASMSARHSALEDRVTQLQLKMTRMLTGYSIVIGIVTFAAPYVIKFVMNMGVSG